MRIRKNRTRKAIDIILALGLGSLFVSCSQIIHKTAHKTEELLQTDSEYSIKHMTKRIMGMQKKTGMAECEIQGNI